MIGSIISLCFCAFLVNAFAIEEETKSLNLNVTNGRIVNGEYATKGQFPWHVAIGTEFQNIYNSWCGGSIISEEWILTAAHCLERHLADFAYVLMGTEDLFSGDLVQLISREFIQHEEYNTDTLANDVGLVKIAPISFNDVIAPIALASDPLEDGEVVTVCGYGALSDDDLVPFNRFLRYITVTTITNSECAEIYGDAILEDMVCTSAGSNPLKGTCYGDTGAAAVLNADTEPLLVGISSFIGGTGCESGNPSGFSRTAYHRDWIREKTGV